jgi:copper chaperone CopZ
MKPDLNQGESHCETVVTTAFKNQPGVLGAVITPERDSVAIDYDPAQLNEAEHDEAAEEAWRCA